MDHVTSRWAAWYGLADPGLVADEVLQMRPDQLLAGFSAANVAAGCIEAGEPLLAAAVQVLRACWSSPLPTTRASRVLDAANRGQAVISRQVGAARPVADAIASCQQQIQGYYVAADRRIATDPALRTTLGIDPTGYVTLYPAVRMARTALISELWDACAAERTVTRAAAAGLLAALTEDPRDAAQRLRQSPLGVPAERATAVAGTDLGNRTALQRDLASSDPARRQFAAGVRAALVHAQSGGVVAQLVVYDPDRPAGQGGVAISIGDVATADHVAVLVPGIANSPGDMSGLLDTADQLRSESETVAAREDTAVVAWLGYDIPLSWPHDPAPSLSKAVGDSLLATNAIDARIGGIALAGFAHQLTTMMSPTASLTLVGHSNGSTVVSEAARFDLPVDNLVLLASPGAGWDARTAADYPSVPADHVYALSFPHDPVTDARTDMLASLVSPSLLTLGKGPFGPNPAGEPFGAEVIDAPSNIPTFSFGGLGLGAVAFQQYEDLKQHTIGNYTAGAAGIAVAAVIAGKYGSVRTRKHQ